MVIREMIRTLTEESFEAPSIYLAIEACKVRMLEVLFAYHTLQQILVDNSPASSVDLQKRKKTKNLRSR